MKHSTLSFPVIAWNMRDPYEALSNWIRVVRSGGHLIISVPEEDLYEQGVWPSTFNPDHKFTFTICKRTTWSPASINLFDLISKFSDLVKPLSIVTIDQAYRYRLQSSVKFCEAFDRF